VQHEPVTAAFSTSTSADLTDKGNPRQYSNSCKGTAVGEVAGRNIGVYPQGSFRCLSPTDIIDFVEIDVSELNIGDSIHAEISASKTSASYNPNQVLVTVAAPTISKVLKSRSG